MRVTEKVTPRIVAHPPAIPESMLLDASALPVNINESRYWKSRLDCPCIVSSSHDVNRNKNKEPMKNNVE